MFMCSMKTALTPRPFFSYSQRLRRTTAIILSSTLIACAGCQDPNVADSSASNPGSPAASPSAESKADALAELLQQAKTGDIDTAVQQFVSSAPDNWIESTALEDLRMSEASFMELDRDEKNRFQQKFIDRAVELKGFAGIVLDRANEAKKKGDTVTAELYLQAVNRLGRQLRDADTVLVFQQTGKALAAMKLSE